MPDLIQYFCTHWQLTHLQMFDNLSFNYVARAHSNYYNGPVVLKIGMPSCHFTDEVRALEYYEGRGCVRLLSYDEQKCGMLLALIEPGTTLRSFFPEKDNQAVEYAYQVIKKLHGKAIPAQSHFPSIDTWFSLFTTLEVPVPMKKHIGMAHQLAQELKKSAHEQYLLHGDLHHDNILLDASGIAHAIDPKGVIGPQAYEVGAFMCNPKELFVQADLQEILACRLDQFSSILEIDRHQLVKACYVRIILSACWTVQDKGDWRDDLHVAQLVLQA